MTAVERWRPSGGLFFVGADGDDMGSHVAKFILANDIENAKKLSKLIHKGEAAVEAFARKSFGGTFVIAGGDDMLLQAPAARFDAGKIEEMRQIYSRVTGGHTITVGVGNDMVEASKALTTGKNTGKNKAVYWVPSMQEKYEKIVADKCNDLLTKCRSQGGMSESELRDLEQYFYATHHINSSVSEAIGDVVHFAKKVGYAHRRNVEGWKQRHLAAKAKEKTRLSRDMAHYGFPKLSKRLGAQAKSAIVKRRASIRKAGIFHTRARASTGPDTGMTMRDYIQKSRQRRADKARSKMVKHRRAVVQFRKSGDTKRAEKARKKSWRYHDKYHALRRRMWRSAEDDWLDKTFGKRSKK